LEEDIHEKYIGNVQKLIQESSNGLNKPSPCLFYITGILLHISPPQQSSSHSTAIPLNRWDLMKMAWRVAGDSYDDQSHVSDILHDDDGVEILEILVEETTRCMSDASAPDLQFLLRWLDRTVQKLWERSMPQVSAVRRLKRMVHIRLMRSRVEGVYEQFFEQLP
jgi:hypothetical protein